MNTFIQTMCMIILFFISILEYYKIEKQYNEIVRLHGEISKLKEELDRRDNNDKDN